MRESKPNQAKPVKKSVSLAVSRSALSQSAEHRDAADYASGVLLVLRPDDDQDFPGMWGLPAGSLGLGESLEQAAERVGRQKLGVALELGSPLGSGRQERPDYTLKMWLYPAVLAGGLPALPPKDGSASGVTFYLDWRWGSPEELADSASLGSLCSQLLLKSRDRQ